MTTCHLRELQAEEPENGRFLLFSPVLLELLSIMMLMLAPALAYTKPLQDTKVTVMDGVTVRHWVYASEGLKVEGELYLPPGEKKLPLVVFNHDGISGISEEHRLSSVRLANAGFVVFSPSYRGEDGSEGMVEIAKGEVDDVLNALPLLKAHPREASSLRAVGKAPHIRVLRSEGKGDKLRSGCSNFSSSSVIRWIWLR